jgi:hypothetical protein
MSTPYQFNYPDMARFFDDLSHTLQTGGMRQLLQFGGEGSIMDKIKAFFTLVVMIVILYIVYRMLFGGYPRAVVNLLTFSFYHKANMDLFLRENDTFNRTFKILLQPTGNNCENPYNALNDIYQINIGTELQEYVKTLNDMITMYYKHLKYDEAFYEAFKEFYLYFDKVNKNNIPIKMVDTKNGLSSKAIADIEFYRQMLGYLTTIGKFDPKGKSDDEKIIEIHDKDYIAPNYKENKYILDNLQNIIREEPNRVKRKVYDRVVNIREINISIGKIVAEFTTLISKNNYSPYIIVPENDFDHQAFANDFKKFNIIDSTIYDKSFDELNEYSWFVIEYLQWKQNPHIFAKFRSQLEGYDYSNQRNIIKKYINVPNDKKKIIEAKLTNRNLHRVEHKQINYSVFSFKELSDDLSIKLPPDFFEFIKKRPIFTHIYLDEAIQNNEKFYNKVMSIYDRFYTNCGTSTEYTYNMVKNATSYKQLLGAIFVFDLYINRYRVPMMRNYQDQYFEFRYFFEKLWRPYYNDFIVNRIGTYSKKTFNQNTWDKSYKKFLVKWRQLGVILKGTMKSITKTFKQNTGVKEPTPEK